MKSADYSSMLNDKIMKERSRLLILSYLTANETNSAAFMTLQKALELSRGNLSVQLQTLKDAEYVSISKAFKDNKPQTTITITKKGISALKKYLSDMERIIKAVEKT